MNNRLPPPLGAWIDRSEPISFRFEGREYQGFRGDVLSSALWANGVRLMGRSFKYHRPRSIYTLSGYDANVIVESDRESNIRGDLLPIEAGLDLRAVNTLGGLERDRYRLTERFGRFMPVGFYYKAFHTPRRLFKFYENQMRKVAGLGRIDAARRSPLSPKDYDFCELLVVGAGPSGLAAAVAAAESGVDVLVVDEQRRPGGSACWQRPEAPEVVAELLLRAATLPNLRLRSDVQAGGWYADQWVALVGRRHITKLRTQATLIASGAVEQPAVFQNNDVPGVMLGSAAQRLIRLYGVKPFERAVVLTANVDGYRVAADLVTAGVAVASIVDLRPEGESSPPALPPEIEILRGHAIYEAITHAGIVRSVAICPLDGQSEPRLSAIRQISCDGVAVSVGWAPNSNLLAQTGAKFSYSPESGQLVAHQLPAGVFTAGRVNGIFSLDDRLLDGRRAGLAAAAHLGYDVESAAAPAKPAQPPSHSYPIYVHPGKKNFVDFDEDLHLVDFANAHQEGYDNIELLKRYSTVGMGPSQGKLSNMNAVRILARLNGQSIDRTGTTTGRPFHQPVGIGLLAGRRFGPYRRTPMHPWHRQAGAHMIHVGVWRRPEYYPRTGKTREACVLDEARNVRTNVGLIDLGTLAKIQVCGEHAAAFLERVYTGRFLKQKVGTVRYAMACDESGVVAEEGLVARLADDRFYVTAGTAGGEAFYREMQRHTLVWRLPVTLMNLTGQWSAMNLAGPNAREVLAKICDIPLASMEFPFGAAREGRVAGIDAAIIRSGFVGELSYEIHLPASNAQAVWNALLEAGRQFDIQPFGTEAQRLLRLEKGHLIGSHDTDALTTPYEAQLDGVVNMDKPFFVGKRSLEVIRKKPVERLLVGIAFAEDQASGLLEECQLIIDKGEIVGRVTSIARQSTIGRPIGLAFVKPAYAAAGTRLQIRVKKNQFAAAEVTPLPFYDPQNDRQK